MAETASTIEEAGVSARAGSRPRGWPVSRGTTLGIGVASTYVTLVVLLPLAAVLWTATRNGPGSIWAAIANPQAAAALTFTIAASVVVALVALVMGTLVAWVLVRDTFVGRRVFDMLIDLPFALPTIVAGLTLLTLYGPQSPIGVNLAFTRASVVLALLFVTLPFVVRAVQPVLVELDREMEEASASLGASPLTTFRRVILPNLAPAMLTGTALSFAKAIGEFGSVVLISGNIPRHTEVASVYVYGQIESDAPQVAAAVSCVLLAIALVVLVLIGTVERRMARR